MIPKQSAAMPRMGPSLPGTRVTAVSGGVTAPLCIRESIVKRGHISDAGLAAQPVTRLLFLVAAFGDPRDIADLITVDAVPTVVTSTELDMFGQITKADVLLLSDSCQFAGISVACQINAVSASAQMFAAGTQQDETETLVTHIECLPKDTQTVNPRDPIIMPDGTRRSVLFVSTDNTGRVFSIHTQKKGAAS